MLRVLFVGDSKIETISAELRRGGFEPVFERVSTVEELQRALPGNWDVAIGGFRAEKFGALEALRVIQDKGVDLPLIVISRNSRRADAVAALKAGAADHLSQDDLMRLNTAVEREVRARASRRERTRLEEQFRQAQKMEAVGRLAGGVAHDFNNLLTVITGYSDLLLTGRDLKENQRTALEEIRRAAERGGALTHQLLAFSRRQPMQKRIVRVNELLIQLEKMLRRLIGEDILLVTILAASRDTVDVDPGRLEQVLMNLAVNSRDAMPDGGKLTIETAVVQLGENFASLQVGVTPGPHLMISISDTGEGMDEETRLHLFEPFFTTKTAGRGTGLGLATAYGIVRQSNGTISISSEKGEGTTVVVYLPLVETKSAVEVEDSVPFDKSTGAETILLVEDEARVRKLIGDVLRGRGYRVLEATRGEEALRLSKTHRGVVNLAVVDVVMPEMSGPDLVKQILAARPETCVLYISGYTDEALVHHGIPQSGVAFLQKPFLPEALARKVRQVLDQRGRDRNGKVSSSKDA